MVFFSTFPTQELYGNYSLCPESQLLLMIHTFCICGFTYTRTATCNRKILGVFSQLFADRRRTVKNVSVNTHIPNWGLRSDAPACFCSGCKHISFSRSVSCRVTHIFELPVGDFTPQHRADMLTAVPGACGEKSCMRWTSLRCEL